MEYRKSMIIIILAIFLVSIASVSAADADDATMASEDTALIEMAQTDELSVSDDSQAIGQSNDEGIISEGNAGTFSELQNNITAISSGTLELGRNYEYDDGFDSSGIKINKTITIDGKGYTIDAKGKSRVFDIKASDVTIKNLIIKNANYNGDGGAVYFGSSGSVTNCNFTKNKATGYGGAVYFDKSGSVLNCNFADNSAEYGGAIDFEKESNINNCNFTNNAASKHGGAIWIYSGTVANCNFTLNKASDSGGAVFFKQKGKVIDCNYVNNIAKFGGAVDFEKESNINNCNFTNNAASENGGAIWIYSGTVANCNFTNNQAYSNESMGGAVFFKQKGNVANCIFKDNQAGCHGGAVYFVDQGTMINCNFTKNKATTGCGGAVRFHYNGTVTYCNFVNNIASIDGGAINMVSGNVSNCNFTNNSAAVGGAVFLWYNTSNVTNCNFANNIVSNRGGAIYFLDPGNVLNCNFIGNTASKYGGAIYSYVDLGVTADTCIFKTDSDTTYQTRILPPTLNVDNFTTFYNSGEKLTFNLTTHSGMPVNDGNISISLYYKNNNSWIGNYSCLSGEGWTVDLPVGYYYAIFNTEYAEFKPIKRTITIIIIPNGTFWALNHIINANDTSEVNLTNDYYYNPAYDGAFVNGVVINRKVTINGNGYTIDAKGQARVFNVQAEDVTIENLTIKNANYNGDGGAIYFAQSGRVINCNFTDNSAVYGGAVDFEKDGIIKNCNFSDNYAERNGGAIWLSSGNVSYCSFTNNTAYYGGAIMIKSGSVENCSFTDNKATGDRSSGGAIYLSSGNVSYCSFTNNTASNDGGAIYLFYATVSYCSFTNNTAYYGGAINIDSGNVANCNFVNNTAFNDGGAVLFYEYCNVANCNFVNNTAFNDGGAVLFYGYGDVANCNFVNNTAFNDGGAINMAWGNAVNCNFVNNTASEDGGAICMDSGTVSYCSFTDNKAIANQSFGGAIMFYSTGNVINCNFTDNKAIANQSFGGAIMFYSTGNVINCNFTGNKVISNQSSGGAIWMRSGYVSNCSFTGNNVTGDESWGGAILMYYSGNVSNCNFTDNHAMYGGAVYFYTNANLLNCNFTNNAASEMGGAVLFYEYGNVENCNFTDNKVTGSGGAIHFYNNGTVTNCNFADNTASRGGAVYVNSTSEIVNCNFTNNAAGDRGGAILFTSTGIVTNCNFTNNTAGKFGGAIYFNHGGEVTNCNFTCNTATTGSAIYFYKIILSDALTISNSTFLNNKANVGDLKIVKNEHNITITFMGQNNLLNAIYSRDNAEVTFNNVTYWGANGITTISSTKSGSNKEAGQNITIGVVANDKLVINEVKVTDENGTIVLDIIASENYYISVRHDEDSYYTGAETIKTNMKFHVNVTEIKTTNKTVNITAKSNIIKNEIISGKLLFILPNGTEINATYADGGIWWAEHTFDDYGDYQVNASYIGLSNVTVNYATISIVKANSTVNVSDVVLYYGETKNVTVTAEGATGITAKINENNVTVVNNYTIPISGLDVGNYTLAVTTIPDEDHNSATKKVNITVNKAPAEITIASSTGEMSVGAMGHVSAELSPSDAGNLSYASNDTRVVSVSSTGVIKANGAGTALITVSFAGNDNYAAAENKTVTITVNLNDASVSVNNSTLDLFVGDNFAIVATTDPVGLNVTYVPDNSGVVSVENGVVTALKEGNATIMVKVGGDGVYAENSTEVTVTVSRIATNITLANETIELKAYKSVGDLATLSPAEAGNLTYASSDEEIALVSEDGIIYARTKGTATVTVSFAGNDKYKAAENRTITVNVTLNDASVSVENDTIDLNVDDTCIIDATANPRFLTVYYASSNESVATVTDYGNVKAVGEGTAIITLTVGNGETYAVNSTNVTITVSKIPTEINIDPASLDLFVGDETVIVANLTPAGAGNVTFTSSDYDVVDFDDECNVIAQGAGQAIITVSFAGDNKYAAAENKTITVTVSLNDASVTVDNDTLDLNVGETYAINATKSPDTILLDIAYTSSNNSVATVNENGVVTAVGEGTAIITVEVGDGEIYAINSTNVTVTVSRIPTEIAADPITATYNADKYLVITLKDANGTPISGENITVDVNGVETYRTDENGSVKVSTNGLASGIYDAKITFNGSAKYYNSAKAVNVTIKKATPVINATAKTFKTTDKTKKYMVILKDSNGNPMANATVTLKVNSKTYYAKTDENGQATFRLTKLTRAATYTAAITYRGDDNYSKVFKKVKLTVKTAFKTVSKGSKDKVTVKKIQVALKSNGYYIKSNGHKLKVDGIYDIYTEKAVKQFQKANGLKVTGKVDENTALKLGII